MVSFSELARALGVTRPAIAKRIRRGMPSESVAAAAAWCRASLDIGRGAKMPPSIGATANAPPSAWPALVEAKNRLRVLQHLVTLTEAELSCFPLDVEMWEQILGAFVTSAGAWPKVFAHVLELAEREVAAGDDAPPGLC